MVSVSGSGSGSFPLGRVVNHDPRSKNFPAQPRKLLKPRSRLHELRAPALQQGDLGSCVGHTAAQWLNCTMTSRNRKRGFMPGRPANRTRYCDDHHARTLYSNATIFDQFGGSTRQMTLVAQVWAGQKRCRSSVLSPNTVTFLISPH